MDDDRDSREPLAGSASAFLPINDTSTGGGSERIMEEAAIPSDLLLRAAILTSLFGMASWILINCIWAEIMLMVASLPEGYSISAWLILFVGCGNVGPMLYVNWPERWQHYGLSTHIQLLLAAAVAIAGLYAAFWNHTVGVGGADRSVLLFLLVFVGNVVSTLMAVSFYPFVGQLPRRCTTALGVGEAFSGIVPSVLALAQSAGSADSPRFSPTAYFCLISGVVVLSFLSFRRLLRLQTELNQLHADLPGLSSEPGDHGPKTALVLPEASARSVPAPGHAVPDCRRGAGRGPHESFLPSKAQGPCGLACLMCFQSRFRRLLPLFVIQAYLGVFAFGILPSLQPYATGRYAGASTVLLCTATLGMLSDPLARLLAGYCSRRMSSASDVLGLYVLYPLVLMATLAAALMLTCVFAADAPLSSFPWGGVVPIAAQVFFTISNSFVNTAAYLAVRVAGSSSDDITRIYGLMACSSQAGSAFGTAASFLLVAVFPSFFPDR